MIEEPPPAAAEPGTPGGSADPADSGNSGNSGESADPGQDVQEQSVPWLLSARTERALRETARRLQAYLAEREFSITDVGFTLATARSRFVRRAAVVAADREAFLHGLTALAGRRRALRRRIPPGGPQGRAGVGRRPSRRRRGGLGGRFRPRTDHQPADLRLPAPPLLDPDRGTGAGGHGRGGRGRRRIRRAADQRPERHHGPVAVRPPDLRRGAAAGHGLPGPGDAGGDGRRLPRAGRADPVRPAADRRRRRRRAPGRRRPGRRRGPQARGAVRPALRRRRVDPARSGTAGPGPGRRPGHTGPVGPGRPVGPLGRGPVAAARSAPGRPRRVLRGAGSLRLLLRCRVPRRAGRLEGRGLHLHGGPPRGGAGRRARRPPAAPRSARRRAAPSSAPRREPGRRPGHPLRLVRGPHRRPRRDRAAGPAHAAGRPRLRARPGRRRRRPGRPDPAPGHAPGPHRARRRTVRTAVAGRARPAAGPGDGLGPSQLPGGRRSGRGRGLGAARGPVLAGRPPPALGPAARPHPRRGRRRRRGARPGPGRRLGPGAQRAGRAPRPVRAGRPRPRRGLRAPTRRRTWTWSSTRSATARS